MQPDNSKISLLLSVGSFYPDLSGGPSTTMYWLTKALKKSGTHVSILTTDRGIPVTIPRNVWLELDYGKCQYVKTLKNTLPFSLFLKSIWALRNTSSLYLASFFYPLSFLLAPVALMLGVKVIWAPRGETAPSALQFSSGKKKIVLWLIRLLRKHIIFHATSKAEIDDIGNVLGHCRIEYIPVGMEIPDPIKCTDNPKNLLFLGRIHPIKGLENLIHALNLSPTFRSTEHRLLIAGYAQHAYDKALKKIITSLGLTEKVVFLGKVEGVEKNNTIACSYALMLPSFSENFGAVVAEALAQGTPAIAAKGTPWEILPEKNAGYHVSNDPESLAVAIDSILSLSKNDYNNMRKNARNLVVDHFSVDTQMPIWKTLLTK